ncbi:hypothetical protein PGT21_023043 [Puccinia graminis f. sp. tritici]|uniref:Uncharacterized protein n=1 Tax=Puccinia graminis f. sp. tritici TaxID=56615 RepID=A0A5B0QV41_PUCGR|nr:hypothetical protein PGT21_023043 [Puccinia graminis f. sp. tritici]KAA1117152.1 hypothetical protein PGTUg99_036449 [Puccinia graminis f. sp. tritici]
MSPVQQAGKPGLVLMIYLCKKRKKERSFDSKETHELKLLAFDPKGAFLPTNQLLINPSSDLIDRLLKIPLRAQPSLGQSSNLNPSAYTQICSSQPSNRWRHALLIGLYPI